MTQLGALWYYVVSNNISWTWRKSKANTLQSRKVFKQDGNFYIYVVWIESQRGSDNIYLQSLLGVVPKKAAPVRPGAGVFYFLAQHRWPVPKIRFNKCRLSSAQEPQQRMQRDSASKVIKALSSDGIRHRKVQILHRDCWTAKYF